MKVGLIGLLFLFGAAIVYGTLAFPNSEDMILLVASASLLALSWVYRREKQNARNRDE